MNAEFSKAEIISTFHTCTGSPGPDTSSANLIDNANRVFMEECLKFIWNKCWSDGLFLKNWKQEERVVLPKPDKDDYNECSAYRTVLLTGILGKRFEIMGARRLVAELEVKGFDADQFAYLKNRSATQALLVFGESVKNAVLTGKEAGAVFFDFTDAFGSVNRKMLLLKMAKDFNISGRLFLHLYDFLSNRQARIKMTNCKGEWLESNVGTYYYYLFILHWQVHI